MKKKHIVIIVISIILFLTIVGNFFMKANNLQNKKKAEETLKNYYQMKLLNKITETRDFVTDNVYSEINIYDENKTDVITEIAKITNDIIVRENMYFRILDVNKIKGMYIIKYNFIFPDYSEIYSNNINIRNINSELTNDFESKMEEEVKNNSLPVVTLTREAKLIKLDGKWKIDELGENINED